MKKSAPSSRSKRPTVSRLTLHQLIGALSFWGASVRLLLVAFLAAVLAAARLADAAASGSTAWHLVFASEVYSFVYIMGVFLVLDVGYVMISRAYPMRQAIDRLVLFMAEALLAFLLFLPQVALVEYSIAKLVVVAPMAVLFLLLLRSVLGLLGSKPTGK